MKRRLRKIVATFGLGMLLLAGAAQAQPEEVGAIRHVIEDGERVETTRRVIISSHDAPRFARTRAPLYLQDLVKLERDVAVGLRIDRPEVRSRHVFVSGLVAPDAPALDSLDIEWDEPGLYEIREHPEQLRGIEFWLKSGLMQLELLRGSLSVRAANTVMHVSGTEVVFVVNEAGDAGVCFLREGTMTFPNYPDIAPTDGAVWVLRDGQRPRLLDLAAPARSQWHDFAEANRREVWRRPFWQRPVFYVPAAVAVGLGAAILLGGDEYHPSDEYEPPRRGITFRLP